MTKITETQKTLLDELLKDYDGNPESLLGDDGLANKLIEDETGVDSHQPHLSLTDWPIPLKTLALGTKT